MYHPAYPNLVELRKEIKWREKEALSQASDAEFDPALHPHEPAGSPIGGEWAPKGGGGGSEEKGAAATPAGKFIVNSHIGMVLKKYGYKKKADDKDGSMIYEHADGHKVFIHPPKAAGAKSSSLWTLANVSGEKTKMSGIYLEKKLAKLHALFTESEDPDAAGVTKGPMWDVLKKYGFTVSDIQKDVYIYQEPTTGLTIKKSLNRR